MRYYVEAAIGEVMYQALRVVTFPLYLFLGC